MPFNTMADAQEFVDFLVSRTRYRVWALAIDRQHANPDDWANDLDDDEWCWHFLLELVGASYILPGSPKGLAQNANATFLSCFQLQSWRFVLPDAYHEICRIMTAENLASRDRVYFLCRLPVVVEASNQTAFADRFPWNLTAVLGSQQASLKNIIQAYRDFCKVGSIL
jgi:hypothetical protein